MNRFRATIRPNAAAPERSVLQQMDGWAAAPPGADCDVEIVVGDEAARSRLVAFQGLIQWAVRKHLLAGPGSKIHVLTRAELLEREGRA